ncbi:MAG: class I SAM-dependent methyltransferase, partial [Vicinamibacterales bacterium]
MAEGWQGWDEYAPFYDWENARTVARRDVAFWQRLASAQSGPVLELGCGTGRITAPVARTGVRIVGIDRSAPMLARASQRLARARLTAGLLRGDIRALPFRRRVKFHLVMAPYG